MRTKKIRGHKRIWKAIKKGKSLISNLTLRAWFVSKGDHVKIWVHPFSGISLTNSEVTEPRQRILHGLFDTYETGSDNLVNLTTPSTRNYGSTNTGYPNLKLSARSGTRFCFMKKRSVCQTIKRNSDLTFLATQVHEAEISSGNIASTRTCSMTLMLKFGMILELIKNI